MIVVFLLVLALLAVLAPTAHAITTEGRPRRVRLVHDARGWRRIDP